MCSDVLIGLLCSCVMWPLCIRTLALHLYLLLPERFEWAVREGSAGVEDGSIYWLISRLAFSVINANEAVPHVCQRRGSFHVR